MQIERREESRMRLESINIDDIEQRRVWCSRLGCTEQELHGGIRAAGSMVENLRLHFRIRRSVRAALQYGRVFGSG